MTLVWGLKCNCPLSCDFMGKVKFRPPDQVSCTRKRGVMPYRKVVPFEGVGVIKSSEREKVESGSEKTKAFVRSSTDGIEDDISRVE